MPLSRADLQPVINYLAELKQKRDHLSLQIEQAERGLAAFTGTGAKVNTTISSAPRAAMKTSAAMPAKAKRKRIRRSPEQLKAEAVKISGLIRKAGDKGVSGNEIRAVSPKIGIDIKGFMKKWGHPVKTKGVAAQMRYFAD